CDGRPDGTVTADGFTTANRNADLATVRRESTPQRRGRWPMSYPRFGMYSRLALGAAVRVVACSDTSATSTAVWSASTLVTRPAGTYNGFRLVIDQSKSSATLKNGMVLSGGSTPGIKFPSAGQSGIKIVLAQPVVIVAGTETDLLVDFNVDQSFVMRGNTVDQNGLLFKPVVNASI